MPPRRTPEQVDSPEEEDLEDDSTTKVAKCIRQVANMSTVKPIMLMDAKAFNPQLLKLTMQRGSPKLMELFKKIQDLDTKDMRTHGHYFKHMIFTDVNSSSYGAKLIASAFAANGFTPAFTNALSKKPNETLEQTKGNNFGLLLSKTYGNKLMSKNFQKGLLQTYNDRPANTHGDLIRFIILDQGFKEGIDIYDVKYVHLFEPLISSADQKQAIGRGTRFCGQKGLVFHPRFGWPLYVFRYDVRFEKPIKDANTMFELFVKYSNIDLRKMVFASEIEKATIEASIDYQLTKEIHSFSIETPPPVLSSPHQKGGAKKVKHIPKAPQSIMNHADMQQYIINTFDRFKYPKAKLENLCVSPASSDPSNTKLTFTPTQDFIRHYFRPESAYKGILLFHSVGSGKTCTAIATATSSFEREGYTILWVTRHTLKEDVWKNMYEQVCNTIIQERLDDGTLKLPQKITNPMRYVSDNWIEPMSYKQFSNMLLKQNKFYEEIVKRNGENDPLRKTLVIIDEAHKLYAPNVVGSEKPKTTILEKMIQNSYSVSGKDSVRVLLMTGTPYTEDAMEMIKLLNNLRPKSKALETDFDSFAKKYLDKQGYFTETGRNQFQDEIAGYVSYINRSQDGRNFAHPVIENVFADITKSGKEVKVNANLIKSEIKELRQQIKQVKAEITAAKKEGRAGCREKLRQQLQECKDQVKTMYADIVSKATFEKKEAVLRCKDVPRNERVACRSEATSKYKTSVEKAKVTKARGLEDCKEKQKACDMSEMPNVKQKEHLLKKLEGEIEGRKEKQTSMKENMKKVRESNKQRTADIKDLRAAAKILREQKKSLMEEIAVLKRQRNADTNTISKKNNTAKLKKLKDEVKNILNRLKDNMSKVQHLNTNKKLSQIEIGRSTLGDISQETALKHCLEMKPVRISFAKIKNIYMKITPDTINRKTILLTFHPDKLPEILKDQISKYPEVSKFVSRVFDSLRQSNASTRKDIENIINQERTTLESPPSRVNKSILHS